MGHMGPVSPEMLLRGVEALARALSALGMESRLAQSGVQACAAALSGEARQMAAAS